MPGFILSGGANTVYSRVDRGVGGGGGVTVNPTVSTPSPSHLVSRHVSGYLACKCPTDVFIVGVSI